MPVAASERRERPADVVRTEAGLDVRVLKDVIWIVIVDERKREARRVNQQCQQGEGGAGEQLQAKIAGDALVLIHESQVWMIAPRHYANNGKTRDLASSFPGG